jgi:hypothetical protein
MFGEGVSRLQTVLYSFATKLQRIVVQSFADVFGSLKEIKVSVGCFFARDIHLSIYKPRKTKYFVKRFTYKP